MIEIIKEKEKLFIKIDSGYFRESDLIMSDFFSFSDNKLVIYGDMNTILYEVFVDEDLIEDLNRCTVIDCFIKLRNSLNYGIQKVLKKA